MISVTRGAGASAATGAVAGRRGFARRFEIEVDQAMGVVEGRAQHLAAGQILEGRRDAAAQRHRGGVERLGEAEARQRGAIGADQEDRLDQIAARLFDRERGDARGRRASPRSSRDRPPSASCSSICAGLISGVAAVAAPPVGEQRMRVADRRARRL